MYDTALYSAPNLTNGYRTKAPLALYFIDTIVVTYSLHRFWRRRQLSYVYFVVKAVTGVLPHVYLVP